MKIHIVQKGDTLWNLAQKYGVDFEHLKQVNSHLSNPDMLMPGMKIKIPTSAVPAKKEEAKVAPLKKEEVKTLPSNKVPKIPKKEMPKEPIKPKVEELDVAKLKELVKKVAPHVLKGLLEEAKPEVIQQIKVEVEMNYHKEMQVKMEQMPTPPKMEPYVPMPELAPMPKPMPHLQPLAEPPKAIPTPKELVKKPLVPAPKHKMPMPYQPMAQAPKKVAMPYQPPCPPLSPYLPSTQEQQVHPGGWQAMAPMGGGMACPPHMMPQMHYPAPTPVPCYPSYPTPQMMPSTGMYGPGMQPAPMGYGMSMADPYHNPYHSYQAHKGYPMKQMLPRNTDQDHQEHQQEN